MYKHYLHAALRRIVGQKLYSLISIVSLAVGMTTALLIFTFLRYENGSDAMFSDSERIYRLGWGNEDTGAQFATFYNPISPLLAANMSEIELAARLGVREQRLNVGETELYANVGMVDNDFFKVLDYPALAGVPDTAVRDEGSAVLTEAAALRLFGEPRPLGRTFTVDGTHDFQVGAIVANNPANSHLGINIFLNIASLEELWQARGILSAFNSDVLYHYVKLAPGADPVSTAQRAIELLRQGGLPVDRIGLRLQPLREVHFTTDLQNEMPPLDDLLSIAKTQRPRSDLLIFAAVGVMTLLIAALNFMNMQTVQFAKKAREIAVRRIAGSTVAALTLQLMSESVLLALMALAFALPLYEVLLPWFGAMVGASLPSVLLPEFSRMAMLILLAALLGVATSLYPAWMAARLPTVAALRGELLRGRGSLRFRSVLIILQFTFSIALIIGSFVVRGQLDYALSKPLGFDPAGVLSIELPDALARNAVPAMQSELLQLAGVESVAAGTTAPTRSLSDGFGLVRAGGDPERPLGVRGVTISENYFETLGMAMVAGRGFSTAYPSDRKPPLSAQQPVASGGIVLNEAAARQAGWSDPRQAVGQTLYQFVQAQGAQWRNEFTVIGVVADAHYGSIRREMEPVSYIWSESYSPNVMLLKIGAGQERVVAALTQLWERQLPESPLRYRFMSDSYSGLYAGEARTFALFIALATLAILVACSGLYGLASWNTERRVKEIGVRKVMGSSVWNIVLLITNDFSRLVLFSNLIAWPLAYFGMSRWLANFAYRIDLTPLVFIGSGAIALCIAWVTVGAIAAKAASAKPVLALRYE
jgi:putative ABC transport system permease protein